MNTKNIQLKLRQCLPNALQIPIKRDDLFIMISVNNRDTVVVNDHIKTIDVINNMKHFIDTLNPDP